MPLYTLALSHLPGISLANALLIYRTYGSAEPLLRDKQLPEGMTPRALQSLKLALSHTDETLDWAKREMDWCQEKNIRILTLNDADYPFLLSQCDDAPLSLFYRGTTNLNSPHIISMVGTRHITEQGKDICRQFCIDLKKLVPDAVVVSGLAYGVDIHTHRACLEQGIETVGVLAHGLDSIYPSVHRSTASEMVRCGGLLTEYPRHTQPKKENFVRRNRIVAGLSFATIVVESAHRGGGLITARLAQDYNRSVFAYPGRVSDQYSEGCNRIIKENVAGLVTCAEDVVNALGWEHHSAPVQRELFPDLSEEELLICHSLMEFDRKPINQIVVETGLPIQKVTSLLFELELKGVVKPLAGGFYRIIK